MPSTASCRLIAIDKHTENTPVCNGAHAAIPSFAMDSPTPEPLGSAEYI